MYITKLKGIRIYIYICTHDYLITLCLHLFIFLWAPLGSNLYTFAFRFCKLQMSWYEYNLTANFFPTFQSIFFGLLVISNTTKTDCVDCVRLSSSTCVFQQYAIRVVTRTRAADAYRAPSVCVLQTKGIKLKLQKWKFHVPVVALGTRRIIC